MARARNIKPGFYKNADLAECSYAARLVFPGLWMLADRCGRLLDRPKQIKGELLPYDSENMDALLEELARCKFILRYVIEDKRYIQILNFEKHQYPHIKEAPSTIPAPDKNCSCPQQKRLNPESPIPITESLVSEEKISVATQPHSSAEAEELNLRPERIAKANGSPPDCPYSALAEAYHEELPELPSIVVLSPLRKRNLQARWREVCTAEHFNADEGIQYFRDFFRRIKSSDFLTGKTPPKPGGRLWRADFDWILNPANFVKIVEGRYHGRRH